MMRTLIGRGWAVILALFILAAGAVGGHLPKFGVEAGTNVLLNEKDPDLRYYNMTRPDWSYDEYAIVTARREDWFTPGSVKLLQEFVEDLKKARHAKTVVSILTVPLLRNRPPALMGLPNPITLEKAGVNLEKARKEILEHTQARGNLVSEDGKDLSVLVFLDMPPEIVRLEPEWSAAHGRDDRARIAAIEGEYRASVALLKDRRTAMVNDLRRTAAAWKARLGEAPRLTGIPVLNINLVEHVEDDLRTFGWVSFALFALAFAVVYRRVRWTAGPILACLLPVLLIVGTMALTGRKVTVVTSNLPVLLFTLMLPYTVYFVERYRERRALFPAETNLDSTAGAAREIWTPCLFSCTTTMAGFASLLTSGVNPVRTFGLMMTIGMGVGLACVFLFLPSLSRPFRALDVKGAVAATEPRGMVKGLSTLVLRRPLGVTVASALLLGVSIWGTTRIHVETKFIDYFWPSSEAYQGLQYIDRRMGGTTPLEIILTSKEPQFFKKPQGLATLDAAARYFAGVPDAGNVRSFKSLVDEAKKAMPQHKDEAVVNLVSGLARDQVREFCNADFTVSRVLIRFKETSPTLHRKRILDGLERHLAAEVRPLGVEARATGVFLLYSNMLQTLLQSQQDTFLMVLAAIYGMLALLFRAPILAAVVLVPQVLPVFVCLGTMGWTGIPLDLVTVMIASIAMGVGIDAAIQYTVRFRIELEAAKGDRRTAVLRSHATIGRAIWIATSIVVVGFAVLGLSKFVPSVYFGLFTALAMLMGQFAALTLLPALFLLLRLPRSP